MPKQEHTPGSIGWGLFCNEQNPDGEAGNFLMLKKKKEKRRKERITESFKSICDITSRKSKQIIRNMPTPPVLESPLESKSNRS